MRFTILFLWFLGSAVSFFGKVCIMGYSRCNAEQMRRYLLKKNPKIKCKFLSYIEIYLEEGAKEGVRGDVAFAQTLHETNFFKFSGDVLPIQNNFSGLGAVGHGVHGAYFKTPREGIRAQIQHLKAYASKQNLCQSVVDPRFQKVNRGCAPYLEDLSGRWAYPGYDPKVYRSLAAAQRAHATYGDCIRKILEEIYKINVNSASQQRSSLQTLGPIILHDKNRVKVLKGKTYKGRFKNKLLHEKGS